MIKLLSKYAHDTEGATAIEYGLIVALLSVAIMVVYGILGTEINATFTTIIGYLSS